MAAAPFTAVDLSPAGYGTSAIGGGGNQQVGSGIDANGTPRAVWWDGTAASAKALTSAGFNGARAFGAGGGQQVGYGAGLSTDASVVHALLWMSANTATNLNPTGFVHTEALATDGTYQFGFGYGSPTGNVYHALAWKGSAASYADLNPSGYGNSVIEGLSAGGTAAGYGASSDGNGHALAWFRGTTGYSGTNYGDLNPKGFDSSFAVGAGGDATIVGGGHLAGAAAGQNHALLWTNPTSAAAVDLNPSQLGITYSEARATNGTVAAGEGNGTGTGGKDHALVWTSAGAASAIDLHALLPAGPGYTKSCAYAVDDRGDVYGYATDAAGNNHAIEWKVLDAGGPYGMYEGETLTLNASGSLGPGASTPSFTWDVNGDGKFGDATGVNPILSWAQLQALGVAAGGSYALRVRADDGRGDVAESAATTLNVTRPAAIPTRYTITNLGTLGGTMSEAYGINDAGQIVGSSPTANGADHAFIYSSRAMQDLGAPATWGVSYASGINATGQVVGGEPGFLYANGQMQNIGSLEGDSAEYLTRAYGVNDTGQVVGGSQFTATGANFQGIWPRAFLYSGGRMTDLGSFGGWFSDALGINNAGQVAGWSTLLWGGGPRHAFLYSAGQMRDVDTLGSTFSEAYGINDAGQVVGHVQNADGQYHAFVYSGGVMRDLGAVGATYTDCGAWAINASGQVVGGAAVSSTTTHAFVYSGGVRMDLNTLVAPGSGWVLSEARAINASGQIVGYGTAPNDQTRAFLLTPNRPPAASAGGPYATSEGGGLALDAFGSSDPDGDALTYSWDVNGDGTFGDATGVKPTLTWAQLQALGINDGPATFTVRVRVDDGAGGVTTSALATLTLTDAPPTVALSGAATATAGVAYALTLGAVIDPGRDTVSGYTVRWGDGTTDTYTAAQVAAANRVLTHAYATTATGPRTILVDLTDEDGAHPAAGTLAVTVTVPSNGGPVAVIGGPYTVVQGSAVALDASASYDPAGGGPVTFTWDLNGDTAFGTTGAAANQGDEVGPRPIFSASGLNVGAWNIALRLTDSAGRSTTLPVAINVVAPPGLVAGAGGQYSIAVAGPASNASDPAAQRMLTVVSGTVALNADLSGTFPNLAVDAAGGTGLALNAAQHLAALTVDDGATAAVGRTATPGTRAVVVAAGGLTVHGTGKVDVGDNALVLRYAAGQGAAALSAAWGLVKSGYHGGDWKGNGGITSGDAAADASRATAVGVADNAALRLGTFAGESGLDGNQVLVRYTLAGDGNLDGTANIADFAALQNHFNQPAAAGWAAGDFNFDGVVNIADFAALQNNFNKSVPPPPAGTAGLTLSSLTSAPAAVPAAATVRPAAATVPARPRPRAPRRRQRRVGKNDRSK